MSYNFLLYDTSDGVATLTLNRPAVHNALNAELMEETLRALADADANPDVRVLVICGAGEKAFCAGADLQTIAGQAGSIADMRVHLARFADLIIALEQLHKPTIASVQGYAFAGGCGLAAACDLTVASEKARFAVPEVNVGLWGMVITAPIFRAIGMKNGFELFYTGRQIGADEAREIGLVNKVVPHENLSKETAALAATIAGKSPLAVSMGREAVYATRGMEYTTAIRHLCDMAAILACTEDCREGIAAFLEKRQPRWSGR